MNQTAVSVIVTVLNRRNEMEICLNSLLSQNYRNYEIIIVDGGSGDGTLEMLKSYQKKNKKLSVLVDKRPNRNCGRNVGIEKAKGEILAFTDSDCVPEKNWLSEIVKPFTKKEIGGVIGTTVADKKGLFWYHMENKYLQFIGHNNAYRASIIKKLGGFDIRFKIAKEDTDLSFRVMEAGWKMVYQPSANVLHKSRRVSVFCRIRNQRTFVYDGLLRRKHPELYKKYMGYSDVINCGFLTAVFIVGLVSLAFFPLLTAGILAIYTLFALPKILKSDGLFKENISLFIFAWIIPIARFMNFCRGFIRFRDAQK